MIPTCAGEAFQVCTERMLMVGTSGLGFCQIGSKRGQTRWNQEKLLFVSALLLRHLGLLADLANT